MGGKSRRGERWMEGSDVIEGREEDLLRMWVNLTE